MHSGYPWKVSLCSGGALQFLIIDADGSIVLMGEMYREDDLIALLSVLQRNPEIQVEDAEGFAESLKARKQKNAEEYLDSLPPRNAMELLRANNYDTIKAFEAGMAAEKDKLEKESLEVLP